MSWNDDFTSAGAVQLISCQPMSHSAGILSPNFPASPLPFPVAGWPAPAGQPRWPSASSVCFMLSQNWPPGNVGHGSPGAGQAAAALLGVLTDLQTLSPHQTSDLAARPPQSSSSEMPSAFA